MLEPIRVPNLQQVVIERVKQYIVHSGLRAGDRLPSEEELAQQLGVSRTAVREALRAMEALGIVSARQGAGRYVRDFSLQPILDNLAYSMLYDLHSFEELLTVREKLEAGFLEDAIAALTPETKAKLRAILHRMAEKIQRNAPDDELLEEDIAFHRALYEPLGNALLLKLLEIFWTVQKHLRARLSQGTTDRAQFLRQHEALVQALEMGDVALAQARLVAHFEGVRAWITAEKEKATAQEAEHKGDGENPSDLRGGR